MTYLDGAYLDSLWDFGDIEASLQRLQEAADNAESPADLELRTQVARAYGLLGKFDAGHVELNQFRYSAEDPVVLQREALERGRLYNSADDTANADTAFRRALGIDADTYLTVDALHMLAIVDKENSAVWTEQGLERARASSDTRVQRWQGSLLNNLAWNLADAGDEASALGVFREAESWFRENGTPWQIHVARWSVAHLLRRTGDVDGARAILEDLKAKSDPDPYVDEELALLGG